MDALGFEAVAVAVGAAIAAVLLWYFRETLKQPLSPKRSWRRIRAWARGDVPARGTQFAVLVADLDGDADGRQTRHVRNAFTGERGFELHLIGRKLAIEDLGNQTEALLAAERQGQAWLREFNGDVLVWGEIDPGGKGLHLRFLSREGAIPLAGDGAETERRPGSYEIGTTGLPLDFNADMNAVIVALTTAAVAPATERKGEYLADLLEPQAKKLRYLCAHMPASLDENQRGGLWHALGLAAGVLGQQKGDGSWLEQATAAYCEALTERTRERVPLDWATTQNNLGTALKALGEREGGTKRLEQAVEAFEAALQELTRERVPLDWGMTQNNLGAALWTLGEREGGTKRLEQAVEAFKAALQELTRERVPLDWAMTQINLGTALGTLGEHESGTARLEQAVEAFEAALQEYTRERVPLDWATTQSNLGTALGMLGEREGGTARLEQAVEAFRTALKVFEPAGATHYAEAAAGNLARAEALLGERRGGAASQGETVHR